MKKRSLVAWLVLAAVFLTLTGAESILDSGDGPSGGGGIGSGAGGRVAGTLAADDSTTSSAVRCLNATQVNFRFKATNAALCTLVVVEVSDDSTNWITRVSTPTVAQQNIALSNTVAGVALNGSPLVAVAHVNLANANGYRKIPYRYCRVKVINKTTGGSGEAITGLSIFATVIYESADEAEYAAMVYANKL